MVDSVRFSTANTGQRSVNQNEIRAVLRIRVKADANECVYPIAFSAIATSNDYFTYYVYKNPTGIAGGSFQDVNALSDVEWSENNTVTTEITGGEILYKKEVARYSDGYFEIDPDYAVEFGPGDVLAIGIQTYSSGANVAASVHWIEKAEVTS